MTLEESKIPNIVKKIREREEDLSFLNKNLEHNRKKINDKKLKVKELLQEIETIQVKRSNEEQKCFSIGATIKQTQKEIATLREKLFEEIKKEL